MHDIDISNCDELSYFIVDQDDFDPKGLLESGKKEQVRCTNTILGQT